jgi:hypothetical protein
MPVGAGKYDKECTECMIKTGAQATVLMVVDGDRGSGFSVTTSNPETLFGLAMALRAVAKQIDGDAQQFSEEDMNNAPGEGTGESK